MYLSLFSLLLWTLLPSTYTITLLFLTLISPPHTYPLSLISPHLHLPAPTLTPSRSPPPLGEDQAETAVHAAHMQYTAACCALRAAIALCLEAFVEVTAAAAHTLAIRTNHSNTTR